MGNSPEKRVLTILVIFIISIGLTSITLISARSTLAAIHFSSKKADHQGDSVINLDTNFPQDLSNHPLPTQTNPQRLDLFNKFIKPPTLNHYPSNWIEARWQGIDIPSYGGLSHFLIQPSVKDGLSLGKPELTPPIPGLSDLVVCQTHARLWGIVNPRETVTISVSSSQAGAARANDVGFFWTTLFTAGGDRSSLSSGTQLSIYTPTQITDISLREINGFVNHISDIVTGTIGGIVSPISVTIYASDDQTIEPRISSYSQTISTDSGGNFSADFSGIMDFVVWDQAVVAYIENGIEVHRHIYPYGMMVRPYPWSWVLGRADNGEIVTVTLYLDDGITEKETQTTPVSNDGFYFTSLLTNVLETDIVTVELANGAITSRTIDPLSASIDVDNDRITGTAKPGATVHGRIEKDLTVHGYRIIDLSTTANASGIFTLNFNTSADIIPGASIPIFVNDTEGDDQNIRIVTPLIDVDQTNNQVSGMGEGPVGPLAQGNPVTLSIYSAAEGLFQVYTKGAGSYTSFTFNQTEDGLPDIMPGDVITVETEGWQGVVQVLTMTVQVDQALDRFTGSVVPPTDRIELISSYWKGELYPINGRIDLLGTVASPFSVTTSGFDIHPGTNYEISHRTADDYMERIIGETDSFGVIAPANAVVGAFAPPGTAFTITLKDSTGGFKGQQTGISSEPIGYIGWMDFTSTGQFIQSNDRVQVQASNGFSKTLVIPEFSFSLDVDNDLVTGEGPANSLILAQDDVQARGFVPTDSEGNFTFKINQLQEVWGDGNLEWGDNVNVEYWDENYNWVYQEFRKPELEINKWNTPGETRPGGIYVYGINFANNGTSVATNTLIIDTLPPSTTWAGDTSGVIPTIDSNGVITWNIGDLQPGENDVFMVSLNVHDSVPTGAGNLPANCATISTDSPGDFDSGNNSSCSNPVDVSDNYGGVNIDKWASPDDPVPGQEFEYNLRWCSDSSVATGPVWLTDSLPSNTTYLNWRPQNSQDVYWTEVITSGGKLVLYAPGLPGNMCQDIFVRLSLKGAVPVSTTLINLVEINTPDDIDLSKNVKIDSDAHASLPRVDMNTNKWFNNGELIPGGWLNYGVNYWNGGNIAVHAWITDTLPPNTSYRSRSTYDHSGQSFEPVIATDDYVVWDLGMIGISQGFGFDFVLDIDNGVIPGTEIDNCSEVGTAETENTPWDNSSCVAETINNTGSNLRISKEAVWNTEYQQLGYSVKFENIGDQTFENVWITDTLPENTSWDGKWDLKFDWSRLISENLGSNELKWQFSELYPGDSGWLFFNANLDNPDDRPRWYTNTVEIKTPDGDVTPDDNSASTLTVNGELNRVEFWVGSDHNDMWGKTAPNYPVTVTTPYTQVSTTANDQGDWQINDAEHVYAGDMVTFTAGNGQLPVIVDIPNPYTVEASSITKRVWGQIGGVSDEYIDINGYWPAGYRHPPIDGSGNYSAGYIEIPRGRDGYIRYLSQKNFSDVMIHRSFRAPDLLLNVNYSDDWIEGNYESGHTVWITVTESDGITIKGTAVLTTGLVPWWNGQSGFSTSWQGWNTQPDIEPDDIVFGTTENGFASSIQIGEISADVDVDDDQISGSIDSSWLLPAKVDIECHPWGAPGWAPNPQNKREYDVSPDGLDTFTCSWDPLSEWDIWPGQNIAVQYLEPDGDSVFAVFHEVAPDPRVEKWVEGNSESAPGSSMVFGIRYFNDGEISGDAILTDTIPSTAAYLSDSSGFPAYISGNIITWSLGTIHPYTLPHHFYLALTNTASPSDTLHNDVDIGTQYDSNWDNNHAEAEVHIASELPNLYINKNANPGDPAPGEQFRYEIGYGNQGSVASGNTCITDTFPLDTSVVSWQSQNGYTLWDEVSSDGEKIVLCTPAIPGNWGDQLYLNLQLSEVVTYGTQLTNTIEINTTDDSDTSDNVAVNNSTYVRPPRYGVSIDKYWGHGSPVPGREVIFWINYYNEGNKPTHNTIVTDTLPSGTTYVESYLDLGWGIEAPIPPDIISGNQLIWQVGDLSVNQANQIGIKLLVNPSTLPGSTITNCATIRVTDFENDPYNNEDCVSEVVRSIGPNLAVTKFATWEGSNRIRYDVSIRNLGSTTHYNVTVTDTYPSMTNMNWWKLDYWEGWTGGVDSGNHLLTVTLNRLEPGSTAWMNLHADLPPVINGTLLTNSVSIDIPTGDVFPADNSDDIVIGTGPDLSIEKWLSRGSSTPQPGDLLTYTLHIRNKSEAWGTSGSVWITDTLPDGLDYVSAQIRLCGEYHFCPYGPTYINGKNIVWNYGGMGNQEWNDIITTLVVSDTVLPDEELINTAKIASDAPLVDIEPNFNDNQSSSVVTVGARLIYLPLIRR